MSEDDIVLELRPSPGRRAIGIGALVGMGVLLWAAIPVQPEMPWRIALAVLGASLVIAAEALRRATRHKLVLREGALRSTDGTVLARLADVEEVVQVSFAFRPSNGFALRMSRPCRAVWRPGLWWRAGRRLGVGGVLPGAAARAMADVIAARIAEGWAPR